MNEFGKIVDGILIALPDFYNVEIDSYIIMPDHIHLIIILDNYPDKANDEIRKVVTLSEVIGKFKSYTTKKLGETPVFRSRFEWQKSFYDRIIRNERELYQIRKYIEENPIRWDIEKNYPVNLKM